MHPHSQLGVSQTPILTGILTAWEKRADHSLDEDMVIYKLDKDTA